MRERLINGRNPYDFETNCSKQVTINKLVNKPISRLLEASDKCFSIEICPIRDLNANLLSRLNVNFCSVTWRNPSTDQLRNVDQIPAILLAKQLRCQGYNVLMHLAGRNLRRHEALDILNLLKDVGVRNLFVLQGGMTCRVVRWVVAGHPPPSISAGNWNFNAVLREKPQCNESLCIWSLYDFTNIDVFIDPSQILEKDYKKCDFPYAVNLIRFIRANFGNYFCIGVTGYPEKHPSAKSLEEDVDYLKQKVLAGANFIITQASYDYGAFKNFCRILRASGITAPVLPGIFIVKSYQSLIAISKFCSVPIPNNILKIVYANRNNSIAVKEFGIHHASTLIRNILSDDEGLFAGFHLFSLNDLSLVKQVLHRLGLLKLRIEYPL